MQLLPWISLAVTITACAATPPRFEYAARIRRTSFGIPHIDAADERGLGYGLGYAFAQDNACVLAEEVVTVHAERSRYFGPDATYEPEGDGHPEANLPSDVYYAVHNAADRVAAAWAAQPAAIQALLRGYARGYNRYLRDAAGALPAACRGQPWVRPITELDLMRVMRRLSVLASGLQMIDAMFQAHPPGAGALRPAVRGTALAEDAIGRRFEPGLGSNAVALGRDATASRAGLLLAAPHFPWHGSLRFYELHLTIPGRIDVFGATLAGLPVVAIGHNADIAWTHTVNTSRHFAFTRLALDPRDPRRHVVDGVSKPLVATDVVIQARQADGTVAPVTHRVWSSELGPLVVIPGLFEWTADAAFALGDANAENTRFLATWWQIGQARSLSELRTALASLGAPWVQTIAVDAAGTATYDDVTSVPNLPDPAAGCVAAGFAQRAATGLTVLDGSTARCRWRTAAGAPAGLIPAAQLPSLSRTDFVQNSNDSAWLTNPAAPLTGCRVDMCVRRLSESRDRGGQF
ncbi:MAG TPA: penicillin acylase family protein [Kofleriaceae bacterium]|nr:penicillin acylase family protein [Kofleriaceae bacterium]